MTKAEYAENSGFLQRGSEEHEEYAEAHSTEIQKETVQTCSKRCVTEII